MLIESEQLVVDEVRMSRTFEWLASLCSSSCRLGGSSPRGDLDGSGPGGEAGEDVGDVVAADL